MQSGIQRGEEQESLPDACYVLRAFKPLNSEEDYQAGQSGRSRSRFEFVLTSSDLKDKPPSLSVYEDTLTTKVQACRLVGDGTTHRVIARLNVAAIHSLKSATAQQGPPTDLRVAWITAFVEDENGQETPDRRPGAEGHAGILGLDIRKGVANRSIIRKEIEVELVKLADSDHTILLESEIAEMDKAKDEFFTSSPNRSVFHFLASVYALLRVVTAMYSCACKRLFLRR